MSQEGNKKWILIVLMVVLVILAVFKIQWGTSQREKQPAVAREATQIYPNYDFPEGVNQIKVPLIPPEQRLSREAGGWVITPAGSGFRADCVAPATEYIIEYIDGRKFPRKVKKPAWDGVQPANSVFRLYGKQGEYATVTIKRGVY